MCRFRPDLPCALGSKRELRNSLMGLLFWAPHSLRGRWYSRGGVWPPTALHTSCSSAGDLRGSPRSGDHRPSGWRGHLPPHDHRSRAPLLLPPWDGLGLGPRKGIKRDVFSPFWQQDTRPAAFRTRTKGLLSPLLTPGPALHFRAESKQHSKRLKERTPPRGLKN